MVCDITKVMSILYFGLVGLVTGLAAGLFGISGGVIIIPALAFLLPYLGVNGDAIHMAIGTSLASMILVSLSSMWAHHRRGGVIWPLARILALGTLIGAPLGALGASILSGPILAVIFGVFEVCVGLRMVFLKSKITPANDHRLPSFFALFLIGLAIASVSALLGIGGGILVVPTLAFFHTPLKKCIGTAAATGFFISLVGAASFWFFGRNGETGLELGYIYVPAFVSIGIMSVITAPIGAALSHRLPTKVLRPLFGSLLATAGLLMLIRLTQ